MEDLKVYDQDGNPLSVTEIVKAYIQSKALRSKKYIDEVYISIDEYGKKQWLVASEAVDNGYDAMYLNDLNISDEIK